MATFICVVVPLSFLLLLCKLENNRSPSFFMAGLLSQSSSYSSFGDRIFFTSSGRARRRVSSMSSLWRVCMRVLRILPFIFCISSRSILLSAIISISGKFVISGVMFFSLVAVPVIVSGMRLHIDIHCSMSMSSSKVSCCPVCFFSASFS